MLSLCHARRQLIGLLVINCSHPVYRQWGPTAWAEVGKTIVEVNTNLAKDAGDEAVYSCVLR